MHEHGLYVYFLRLAECNTQRFLMTESYPITTLVSITTSSNYVVIAAFPTHAKKGAIAQERSSDIVQFCGSISSQACFRLFYLAKFSIICVNLQVLKVYFGIFVLFQALYLTGLHVQRVAVKFFVDLLRLFFSQIEYNRLIIRPQNNY